MTTHITQLTAAACIEERKRIRDILMLGRVLGSPQLAEVLAFDTDLNVSQAEIAFSLATEDRERITHGVCRA